MKNIFPTSSSCLWAVTTSISIYEYNTPIVSVKQGNGNIISGTFKIIHKIDLTGYENILNTIESEVQHIDSSSTLRPQLRYQIKEMNKLLEELKGRPSKAKRSIDWIGSAWKWIAGSPDATDWNEILKSQNRIIENNNEQYKINTAVTQKIQQMISQHNEILLQLENGTNEVIQQTMFNRLLLIKEDIKEIVRAIQLAKAGIINSNLLDQAEINRLITEIETLPYTNSIEAIEYAEPAMLINNSTILYIISMPKTSKEEFHHIQIRSTIRDNKQVYLEYDDILINQNKIYGITKKCHEIREVIICEPNHLQEIKENHCISQLMKGLNAGCEFSFNENEIIEPLNENTIFLSNFDGILAYNKSDKHLKGSYLIQYQNETVEIKDWVFTNKEIKTHQILPPVLQTNITEQKIKLNLEYLHNLHTQNIGHLQKMAINQQTSYITSNIIDMGIITTIIIILTLTLIRRLRRRRKRMIVLPSEKTSNPEPTEPQTIHLNF